MVEVVVEVAAVAVGTVAAFLDTCPNVLGSRMKDIYTLGSDGTHL